MALPLSVLFEDEELLVVDKPACFHSVMLAESPDEQSAHNDRCIAALLIREYPAQREAAEKPEDGGLIQRLDYETSGVLIAAKTRSTWLRLRTALLAGEFRKEYFALLDGTPDRALTAESYLGNRHRGSRKVSIFTAPPAGQRALPATTTITPLGQPESDRTVALVEAHRAARHQIRAHAAWLGYPLTGDTLYGSTHSLPLEGEGSMPAFFLHASRASFSHPERGEGITVTAPPPSYLDASVSRLIEGSRE